MFGMFTPALVILTGSQMLLAQPIAGPYTFTPGGRSQGGPYTAESTIGEPYTTLRCDAGSIDLRLGYLAATESEWIIPCPADISNDGDVSVVDLLILLDAWGTNGPLGDVNYDGIVDTNDILLILSAWGPCP